jgi:hypothetical protein
MSIRSRLAAVSLTVASGLVATTATAQTSVPTARAGVVTTLQGTATVARTALPPETPLRAHDDVYVKDRIATGDEAFVRMLLGGKAVVTVRERSVLTISETPTTSTIAIQRGRFALSVDHHRMKPGEAIEIRTPNAITTVRGTTVIAEVFGTTSRFTLLSGKVSVDGLDARTLNPLGAAVDVKPRQRVLVVGFTPPGRPLDISQAESDRAAADFSATLSVPPASAYPQLVDEQLRRATQSAAATDGATPVLTPTAPVAPLLPADDLRLRTGTLIAPPSTVPAPPSAPVVTAPPPTKPTVGGLDQRSLLPLDTRRAPTNQKPR